MSEYTPLLHNMSAPPKSVVKYSGLSGLAEQNGHARASTTKQASAGHFGLVVRFTLPPELKGASPAQVLQRLEVPHDDAQHGSPEQHLRALINRRAAELPLPEGCAVITASDRHPVLWDDPLAALAVLAKSTDTVWLGGKTPALSSAVQRESVSLLVPPAFAHRLGEKAQ